MKVFKKINILYYIYIWQCKSLLKHLQGKQLL